MGDGMQVFVFDMTVLRTSCSFGYSLAALYSPGVLLPIGIIGTMIFIWLTARLFGRCAPASLQDFNNVINTLGVVLTGVSVAVFKAVLSIMECRENPEPSDDTLAKYEGYLCYGPEVMQ